MVPLKDTWETWPLLLPALWRHSKEVVVYRPGRGLSPEKWTCKHLNLGKWEPARMVRNIGLRHPVHGICYSSLRWWRQQLTLNMGPL